MRTIVIRSTFWGTVVAAIIVINACEIWSAREVRDWVFGQTGAAWIQAIGSVAAMAITIGIWQRSVADERARALATAEVFAGKLQIALAATVTTVEREDFGRLVRCAAMLHEILQYGRSVRLDVLRVDVSWELVTALIYAGEAEKKIAHWVQVRRRDWPSMAEEARGLNDQVKLVTESLLDVAMDASSGPLRQRP